MSDLNILREKIDALDGELIRLLNERALVAKEIGEVKHRDGLPIYAPEREEQVLRSLVERSVGPLKSEAIRAIYREIMSASLALEKDMVIACLGPAGSLSHQAARSKFGSSVRYVFHADISDIFGEVKSGTDCGVIPIEDPEHGLSNAALDQLAETELSISSEIFLPIESGDEQQCARFFVLGRDSNPPSGSDYTMLMLRIEDKPGALVSALEPFKTLSINLNHFASRPASKGSQDIFFFVEAAGHTRELQMADLFQKLSKSCRAVKVLGSYPKISG